MNAFKNKNGHQPEIKSKLILLAEDHPLNQKVALLLLGRMGFDAHAVSDGRQAVEAAARIRYDAILMDCHMPEMDGFEATVAIRKNDHRLGHRVPIIAVTALTMAGDRERCLAAGMDDYITKPIDRDVLQAKLVHWTNPGTLSAFSHSAKVIPMFDGALVNYDQKEEPLNIAQFFDAYGEEAPELLLLFVNSSERIVLQLEDSISAVQAASVGRYAHELKGASWAVGADELARSCVFLEQAAGQENWRLVHRTFSRLHHQFQDVKLFVLNAVARPETTPVQ